MLRRVLPLRPLPGDDGGLPGPTDSWVTLGGLARETSRIRLGTLVTPVTFRSPGVLAISVAQVDPMSGGRVELGLGAGWSAPEHAAYALPFPSTRERFGMLEEQLAIVTGLWQTPVGERFDYTGSHYTVMNSPGLPKPVQRPSPPIVMGGRGRPRSARLAAGYAAEYNVAFAPRSRSPWPSRASRPPAPTLAGRRTRCASRSPRRSAAAATRRGVAACRRDRPRPSRAAEFGLGGTPDELVERIGGFADLGASTVYLQLLDLDDLDQLALLADAVLPQIE